MGMLSKFVACVAMAVVTVSCAADYSEVRTATQLIIASNTDLSKQGGEYEYGSGVVVAPGYVLTAKHVVSGQMKYLYAGTSDKDMRVATVVKMSDSPVDLALLSIPNAKCPCISLVQDDPVVDDDLVDVGFPLYNQAGTQFLTHGAVQGYSGKDNYQMMMNVNIAPGNSGGGVYVKTATGWKLAGIAVAVMTHDMKGAETPELITWMSVAMAPKTIREFLKGTPAEQ